MEKFDEEDWRLMPAPYEAYECCSDGRIRHNKMLKNGLIKVTYLDTITLRQASYPFVNVYFKDIDGYTKRKNMSVARCILMAFDPRDNYDGLDAMHLNGVTTDNRIENLKWGTRSENNLSRVYTGRRSKNTGIWVVWSETGNLEHFNNLREFVEKTEVHYSTAQHLLHVYQNNYSPESKKYGISRMFYDELQTIPKQYIHRILNLNEENKLWE